MSETPPTKVAEDIVWRLGQISASPDLTNAQEIKTLGQRLSTLLYFLQDDLILQKVKEAINYLQNLPDDLYERLKIEKERFILALRETFKSILQDTASTE